MNGINSPAFDVIFYWISSKVIWVPLYLFLVFLVAKKWGWQTLIIGLFIGLVFFIGDRISVVGFKEVFQRLRPCHNPDIAELVHIVNNRCGGQYGFVSSHATNSFALAIFITQLFKKYYKRIGLWMISWALLVSYSRIYLGVHYPGDIIGGTILGCSVGYFCFWLLSFMNAKLNFKIEL